LGRDNFRVGLSSYSVLGLVGMFGRGSEGLGLISGGQQTFKLKKITEIVEVSSSGFLLRIRECSLVFTKRNWGRWEFNSSHSRCWSRVGKAERSYAYAFV